MEIVRLTTEEAEHLVLSVVEAIEHLEDGVALRESWPDGMRDWCLMLTDPARRVLLPPEGRQH